MKTYSFGLRGGITCFCGDCRRGRGLRNIILVNQLIHLFLQLLNSSFLIFDLTLQEQNLSLEIFQFQSRIGAVIRIQAVRFGAKTVEEPILVQVKWVVSFRLEKVRKRF